MKETHSGAIRRAENQGGRRENAPPSLGVLGKKKARGKSMKKQGKRSTLARYLLTYLSVVLAACALIGETLGWRSMAELNELEKKKTAERVSLALDELEAQRDAMFSVVNNIAYEIYYRPIYVESNKFYELERIADFKKYASYATLVSDYFLLYDGTGEAYTTSSKIDLPALSWLLGVEAKKLSPAGLNQKGMFILSPIQLSANFSYTEGVLFVVTSHLSGIAGEKGDFSVLFIVQPARLRERLERISGLSLEEYALFYGGQRLLGGLDAEGEPVLSARGDFSAQVSPSAWTKYNGASGYMTTLLLLGGGLTLVMLLFGALAAYSMYRPIQRVADRMGGEMEKDKLLSIENTIAHLEKENQLSRVNLNERLEEIKSQKRQMRQQLLNLLFNGVWTEEMERQIELAQMELHHALFAVLKLRWPEEYGKNSLWLEQLMESMQDEELSLYGAWHRRRGEYWLLLNAENTDKIQEAVDILQECLESRGLDATVRRSQICQERGQLPVALASIQSEAGEAGAAATQDADAQSDLQALARELRAGRLEEALRIVQRIERAAPKKGASLMQHVHRLDVLHVLLDQARQNGMTLSEELLERLLQEPEEALYLQDCHTLMNALCTRRLQNIESAETHEIQEILQYIQSQLTNPQLSISGVSDHFRKNSRLVGKLIYKYSGMTYKEYVTRQKMEYAKRLLLEENKNVDETSEILCYANAAYFIKVFKEETGMTPGQFKKSAAPRRE